MQKRPSLLLAKWIGTSLYYQKLVFFLPVSVRSERENNRTEHDKKITWKEIRNVFGDDEKNKLMIPVAERKPTQGDNYDEKKKKLGRVLFELGRRRKKRNSRRVLPSTWGVIVVIIISWLSRSTLTLTPLFSIVSVSYWIVLPKESRIKIKSSPSVLQQHG